jgi:cell division protein FtsQ
MKKFLRNIGTDQNMVRLGMGLTVLLFLMFYEKAGRFKNRALSGQMQVHVQHLENGNDFITTEEMRSKILRKFQQEFSNVPLATLDLQEIEAGLQSMDFIKSTDVYLDASNRLNIFVKQREPILRILTPEGNSLYVDKDGSIMPASPHYSPRVLVAFAPVSMTRDSLELSRPGMERDLFELANFIARDRFLHALVEEIMVHSQNDWTLIPKFGPSRIFLGDLERLEDKTDKLKRVYREILPGQGWDLYYSVNLKFKGQVICTKRA